MNHHRNEQDPASLDRKWTFVFLLSAALGAAAVLGAVASSSATAGRGTAVAAVFLAMVATPLTAYLLVTLVLLPPYRRLEDENLELHIRQEELLDTRDDLFVKFLGIYDVNYAANSPRLFDQRLNDVAEITATVMETDRCLIWLYEKRADELFLAAASKRLEGAVGKVRLSRGDGIEGWVGRRLEPVMLKDLRRDDRYRDLPGLDLGGSQSVYCLPLYVYANGALVGALSVYYPKPRVFRDEEINFFTTLSGLLSTTVQNEQMQIELRKMNMELEQWVAEKTEELRSSEERYRTLVENAFDPILLLAMNGDIVFANEQASRFTGWGKYDLVHKNLFDLFAPSNASPGDVLGAPSGQRSAWHGELRRADGTTVAAEVHTVDLMLINRRFLQCVVREATAPS